MLKIDDSQSLEELEQIEKALWIDIRLVEEHIRALKLAACPIKVGDIVRYKRDGKEYRVIEVDRPEWKWVYANPRKADGSWGTQRRHLLGDITAA